MQELVPTAASMAEDAGRWGDARAGGVVGGGAWQPEGRREVAAESPDLVAAAAVEAGGRRSGRRRRAPTQCGRGRKSTMLDRFS